MNIEKINLKEKLKLFNEHWKPKIISDLNDSYVKIAKIKGEFDWHHHEQEDELFYIINGNLTIQLRDKDLHLKEGELVVIPKGVEHKPVCEEEVHIMMIEPKTTLNTGNVNTDKTVSELERI